MGRTAGYSKRDYNYRTDSYIEGNVVRDPKRATPRRQEGNSAQTTRSTNSRRNRERAARVDMKYVGFLCVAALITISACVHFLRLQATSTAHLKRVTSLESQLSTLKMDNDAAYEQAVSSVDLEHVKDVAINEFGMIYADQGQIITYDSQDSDYVRQYEDVPTE
jgi:cell division protein FtsL